jgi:hypothetical protein
MMKRFITILFAILLILSFSNLLLADKVKEDSTDLMFERVIKFSSEENAPDVVCTGTGVRKKFVVKVYGAAIYVEPLAAKEFLSKYMPSTPPEDIEDFTEELAENEAFWNDFINGSFHKVIVMRFVRDVGADSIVGAYEDGFEENLKDKSEATEEAVKKFLGLFKDEIKDGQDMTLRFAPDGTIWVDYAGKECGSVKNLLVARSLLANWFGEDPISDDIKEGGMEFIYTVLK